MLWSSENWSGNKANIKMMDTFYYKSIRRILGITMGHVKDKEMTNSEIRCRFSNIEPLYDTWRKRQLLFISYIVRLKKKLYPLLLLTATVDRKRSRGRPFQTIKDTFINNLLSIFLNLDCRENVNDWIGFACNARE